MRGGWDTSTSMITARIGGACAALGGKIYVMGGEDTISSPGITNLAEVYDPRTTLWSPIAPMTDASGAPRTRRDRPRRKNICDRGIL